MDNKKIVKFLYKDIAELEELFAEKGASGFDEFELQFIQRRFEGAKQLINMLKENNELEAENTIELPESRKDLQSEEVKKHETEVSEVVENKNTNEKLSLEEVTEQEFTSELQLEKGEQELNQLPEESEIPEKINKATKIDVSEQKKEDEQTSRLGDTFEKETSVNEFLGDSRDKKLGYKISHSRIESIKVAIGINDRYQYIRELFEGSVNRFNKAVEELDQLESIQEAVTYLQENYKWKKNPTSLKFIDLVKRRFSDE